MAQRERARARDKKNQNKTKQNKKNKLKKAKNKNKNKKTQKNQRRRTSLATKHENFKAVVRKWEILAGVKWKWVTVKKEEANRNTTNKILCMNMRNFFHKTRN